MSTPTAGAGRALVLPLAALVGLLLVWPMLLLLEESFYTAKDPEALSLAQYSRIVLDAKLVRALLGSVGLSLSVALASTALCLAPAWLLVQMRPRSADVLRAVYALPLSFSGVIVGFLIVIMIGRAGLVPRISRILTGEAWFSGAAYAFLGVVLAYLYFEIPRATLTLEAALRRIDSRLSAAARSLGASRWQALRYVVLPALRPALLSTLAITFSVSLGSFGVILILTTRDVTVLPLEIFMAYLAFPSDRNAAAAMSVMLLALALLVNYAARVSVDRTSVRDAASVEPARREALPGRLAQESRHAATGA